jgi:hypothetical protein
VSVEVISQMICRPSIRVQNVMGIMVKLLAASFSMENAGNVVPNRVVVL